MLSGGTHSMIHPFGVTGFNLLTALCTNNDAPATGLAPVRSRPRRLRAGRRRGHGRARRAGTRPGPRGADLRRGHRLRLDGRRLPHHRHPPRGPRRHAAASRWRWKTPGSRPTTSTTSTPTAPAPASTTRWRPWRSRRSFGRAGLPDPRLQHQEHDGPPDCRGRGHGVDHLPAGDPRRRAAAHDQLRQPRSRLRPGLRPQRGPRSALRHTP